jgi:glutathione peroxidase
MLKGLIAVVLFTTSIYSVPFTDINGSANSFNDYQGKKILIVNIATGSDKISQIGQLQKLYQQYQDSLAIVAFPSNSFGKEDQTNAQIKQTCEAVFHTTFIIGQKGPVKGAGILPIYNWLAHQSENGVMNGEVISDFQKFLIDKNGALIGVFTPDTDPMDISIRNAITDN